MEATHSHADQATGQDIHAAAAISTSTRKRRRRSWADDADSDALRRLEEACSRLQLSGGDGGAIGRDQQRRQLTTILGRAIMAASHGVAHQNTMYVSGMPGVGKTTVVNSVLQQLKQDTTVALCVVHLNGWTNHDAQAAYKTILQSLRACAGGDDQADEGGNVKESAKQRGSKRSTPCEQLERLLRRHDDQRPVLVVVVDEMDVLEGPDMDRLLYNLLQWCSLGPAKMVLLALANKMDLPDGLSAKVESRFAGPRIVFPPYTATELVELVQQRVADLGILDGDMLRLCTTAIARASGDARQALNQCRHAVEARLRVLRATRGSRQQDEDVEDDAGELVTIHDLDDAAAATNTSPLQRLLRSCSKYECVLLVALTQAARKVVNGSDVGDAHEPMAMVALEQVVRQAELICRLVGVEPLAHMSAYLRVISALRLAGVVCEHMTQTQRWPRVELRCVEADVMGAMAAHPWGRRLVATWLDDTAING